MPGGRCTFVLTGLDCVLTVCVSVQSFLPPSHTFSVSSFLTDFRLARRSMETLCLEPSRERRMASAETRTRRRLGLLNFPLRSNTLMFRSLIWSGDKERDSDHCRDSSSARGSWEWTDEMIHTSRVLSMTLASMSYRSSSTTSTLSWSSLQRSCQCSTCMTPTGRKMQP